MGRERGIAARLPFEPDWHLSTVATYLLLLLYFLRYFEKRTSSVKALGFSVASMISAVAFYEFLFKVSFPLADPYDPGRLEWLLTADLVPAVLLFLMTLVFLVSYRWWILDTGIAPYVSSDS